MFILTKGFIQVSPSSYIGSHKPIDLSDERQPLDWWRCDSCGAAIGKINQALQLPQTTCYQCGAPMPERYASSLAIHLEQSREPRHLR